MQFDAATETHLALLYPGFAEQLRAAMEWFWQTNGRQLRISEALRSFSRQAVLFAQGRSSPGRIVTNALPGFSGHHYGTDADLAFKGMDPYLDHVKDAAAVWKAWADCTTKHGMVWGGTFPDPDMPHVESRFTLTIDGMHDLYLVGGISAVWHRLDELRGVPLGTDWYERRLFDPNK